VQPQRGEQADPDQPQDLAVAEERRAERAQAFGIRVEMLGTLKTLRLRWGWPITKTMSPS
jgi:hypothetical protein